MTALPFPRRPIFVPLETRVLFATLLGFEYIGPTTIHPGSTLSIEYEISGGSSGTPETGNLELYLSKDAVFDAGDTLVARPEFSIEGTETVEVDVNPPGPFALPEPGLYRAILKLGSTSRVDLNVNVRVESAGIVGSTLSIGGTPGPDTIALARDGVLLRVHVNGQQQSFQASAFDAVEIAAGDGDDVVTIAKDIADTFVDAGSGNDSVTALVEVTAKLAITGSGGDDTIVGGGGDDELSGANGKDRINGGGGNDYLLGGASRDFLVGGTGDDTCSGAGGNDRLFGDAGSDYLLGGAGNDVLDAVSVSEGIDGIDTLSGNAGLDRASVNGDETVAGIEQVG